MHFVDGGHKRSGRLDSFINVEGESQPRDPDRNRARLPVGVNPDARRYGASNQPHDGLSLRVQTMHRSGSSIAVAVIGGLFVIALAKRRSGGVTSWLW
jgi:hypothetical protein